MMASAEPAGIICLSFTVVPTFQHRSDGSCMTSAGRSRSCGLLDRESLDDRLGRLGCPFRVLVVDENGSTGREAHPRVAADVEKTAGARLGRAYHDPRAVR